MHGIDLRMIGDTLVMVFVLGICIGVPIGACMAKSGGDSSQ